METSDAQLLAAARIATQALATAALADTADVVILVDVGGATNYDAAFTITGGLGAIWSATDGELTPLAPNPTH